MEVELAQDAEMTESTPKVYDIIHPTPVSLKKLSAMAITLELWRREVNRCLSLQQLEEFDPYQLQNDYTWIKTMVPGLPSPIYKKIEKIFTKFVRSIEKWLIGHYRTAFSSYNHKNCVLPNFNDFVCDFDGSVHYTRTAERMMRCEKLDTDVKFSVACMYFFEDDIRRIWPSVSEYLSVCSTDFYKFPQLYYWICCLTNDLNRIPISGDENVDERMLHTCLRYNRPSAEYFWNRIPIEKQMRRVNNMDRRHFARFILPKLNDRQLEEYVNKNRGVGFFFLIYMFSRNAKIALKFWMYIKSKNIMSKSTFTRLVVWFMDDKGYRIDDLHRSNWEYLCREIWNNTSLDLKQSAISFISSESTWLKVMTIAVNYQANRIRAEFLLTILQDASFEEKHSFFRNCWHMLVEAVRTKDLLRIMQLCFKSDDEMAQFKQNVMINSEAVLGVCISLFTGAYFDELNAFVSFCCAELQTARNLKEKILQSVFLDGDCQLSGEIVNGNEQFNVFVNDVSTNFKDMLMSSASFIECLASIICDKKIPLEKLKKFIGIFVSTQEALTQIKMSLIDSFREYLITDGAYDRNSLFQLLEFNAILLWCLGSNEEVEEFKSVCS